MSEELWIAIIGAAAVVLTAIIGGIFMYISREKKKKEKNNSRERKLQELKVTRGKFKYISQRGKGITKQSLSIKDTSAEGVNQESL